MRWKHQFEDVSGGTTVFTVTLLTPALINLLKEFFNLSRGGRRDAYKGVMKIQITWAHTHMHTNTHPHKWACTQRVTFRVAPWMFFPRLVLFVDSYAVDNRHQPQSHPQGTILEGDPLTEHADPRVREKMDCIRTLTDTCGVAHS